MRRIILTIIVCLLAYGVIIPPFTDYMKSRLFVEKLGAVPNTKALNYIVGDQKQMVAATLLLKTFMYFGGRVSNVELGAIGAVDYPAMSRTIHAALRLDPYNIDGYYFAQAVLVWDVAQYALANNLLEYGMKYRTWDWYLPYFAGFNDAYFLHDYPDAAKMYMLAGKLSGNTLFINLAGRYLQKSGQTEMAIAYLTAMDKGLRAPAVKKIFQVRIQAFKRLLVLERARDRYIKAYGSPPPDLNELVTKGYLRSLPSDPYGGKFIISKCGEIMSTSKFAYTGADKSK